MKYVPRDEIETRIRKLKQLMEKASLDGAFFHYKIDYYYLSGTMQDCSSLCPFGGKSQSSLSRGRFPGHEGNHP